MRHMCSKRVGLAGGQLLTDVIADDWASLGFFDRWRFRLVKEENGQNRSK